MNTALKFSVVIICEISLLRSCIYAHIFGIGANFRILSAALIYKNDDFFFVLIAESKHAEFIGRLVTYVQYRRAGGKEF